MYWKRLLKAAKFARKAHGAQKRAHGTPYFRHPAAVARLLWDKGHRELDLLRAAYLHDILEDTNEPIEELYGLFGWDTMTLVRAVTKRKGEDYEAYYERVRAVGPLAMALKMADREHNNSELYLAPPEKAARLREKAEAKTAMMLKVFSRKD